MVRRGIIAATVVASAGLGCSFLVGLDGLHSDGGAPTSDAAPDVVSDAPVVDAGRRCDPQKPFSTPAPVLGLSGGGYDRLVTRMSPDELAAYVSYSLDGGAATGVSERSAPDKSFGPFVPIGISGGNHFGIRGDLLQLVTGGGIGTRDCRRPQLGVGFSCAPLFFEGDTDASLSYFAFPQMLPNGRTMYGLGRTLDPDGGPTSYFVAVSRLSEDGGWSTPVAVAGIPSTTTSPTMVPYVLGDEKTIYYATVGTSDASSSYDILVARRATPSDPFGPPEVVVELSSKNVDLPSWVSEDDCVIYLSSTRLEGARYVYRAQRPL